MKKILTVSLALLMLSTPAFAVFVVVMKDGTRYKARSKWTVVNGRAIIHLESGQRLQVDPNLIDVAKTDEINKLGLGDVSVIGTDSPSNPPITRSNTPSLGEIVRRRQQEQASAAPAPSAPTADPGTPAPVRDQLSSRVRDNFERAYENIGIYERKLSGSDRVVRAELTADNEERVFNAISATAFLLMRNAGVSNLQIDMVELFMKTTTGGAAGRFRMSRADAEAIQSKRMSIPDYFVRHVIY